MPLPNVAEAILNTIILNPKENNTKPNACAKKSLHGVPCRRGDLLVRVVGGKIYGCKGRQIWGRIGETII